jgi:hypothetical protein
MSDAISIPGGKDLLGCPVAEFVIGPEHTVLEWCCIYTDGHPTALLGDDSRTATAEMQDTRLTLLGACGSNVPRMRPHPTETDKGVWDDPVIYRTRNAVYQELADAIECGRLDAKHVYLDDRPGKLDPTLCIIGATPVLAIAQRRRDYGERIAALLRRTGYSNDAAGAAQSPADAQPQPRRNQPRRKPGSPAPGALDRYGTADRIASPPSRLKPFWAEAETIIMRWFVDDGCPADRDGGQAKLEDRTAELLAAR